MEFLYPNVLWMMLAPSILLIYLISTNKTNLQLVFEKEILQKLKANESGLDVTTRNILIFTSLLLLILALSRPVILQKEKEIKQNLIPVVVALDVSKSMLSNDIYPNRLELAKKKIKVFLNISKNSAIGIVFFAKSTFILSPITKDFNTLSYMLENIDSRGLNFDNGSNFISLLESSNELLEDYESKNIIILSDGGNNTQFYEEIDFIKNNNIKVYVIATATKKGAPIPTKNGYLTNKDGDIVTVKLNDNIKDLALDSGGGYIDFTIDDKDIKAINSELLSRSKKEQLDTKKIKLYTELFYYPLALGIFFLFISLFSFPRLRQNSYIFVFLLSGFFTPSYSGILDFQTLSEAKEAYENKNYKYASNQYKKVANNNEANYNLGNSLYKEGKYKEAISAYEKVVTSDKEFEAQKLHNMGNAYVKLNNLDKAKEMYENALKKHFDKETKENLDKINDEIKKKENKNNQQNKDQNNSNQNKKNEEQKEQNNKKENTQNKDKKAQDKKQKDKDKLKDKESKKELEKKQKSQNENNKQGKNPAQKELSDMEEKKWMQKLKDQKAPILLHKSKTQSQDSDDSSTPW